MNLKFIITASYALVTFVYAPIAHSAYWDLQSSIIQAMTMSPELKQSKAKIGERAEDLKLSNMWPDPSIEFKVDNKIGIDKGSDNYGLAEIKISQEIPFSRLKYQKQVAEANLNAAIFLQQYDRLLLENKVAKIFYKLQRAKSIHDLAVQRVKLADKLTLPVSKNTNRNLIRYLTPLEKMRLGIIKEKARQAEAVAEGTLKETFSEFRKILSLKLNSEVKLPTITAVKRIPTLSELKNIQTNHPLLVSQQKKIQAANSDIELARSTATKDPSISVNQTRENFPTGTQNVYGIMLNFDIPIHDRKSTVLSKASYNASQQRIELARLKRSLGINLNRSFTHIHHIIEQTSKYNKKVLKPASKILTLSKNGFMSGELNILSLIDANNTYFDSHMQFLELIYQSKVELADLNLYAGKLISKAGVE